MSLDGHVRLLPVQVANKIAAGEVVERPASVVKELLENAFDAGAASVEVHVTAGGRKLVEVRDDGAGMTRDDALLAIERHATSKIRDVDDIERIATLGFRGEALPSIAAVSRFTLATCRRGESVGTEIAIAGGRLQDVKDAGVPAGTAVAVRDLFFNVPARRKFLRAYETEQAHIRHAFVLHALAHPEVALLLKADGREAYRLPGGATLEDRVRGLFGAEFLAALRPVERTAAGVSVRGYVGIPTLGRGDRAEQYLFVNRRPATAPVIAYALREAFPPGEAERRPAVLLFLELDPEQVDVNVHPSKREVRFRRPADVRDAIIAAVGAALGRPPRPAPPAAGVVPPLPAPGLPPAPFPPPREDPSRPLPWREESAERGTRNAELGTRSAESGVRIVDAPPLGAERPPTDVPHSALRTPHSALDTPNAEFRTPHSPGEGSPWHWVRVVGQVAERYALLETDGGYVVLDPRAAHERVLYEKLWARVKGGAVASQRLLLPETVQLPPAEAARLRKHLPLLQANGFGVDDFGNDHFVIEALPEEVMAAPRRELLLDIGHDLETAGSRRGAEKWREEAVVAAACRAAVDGRQGPLAPEEIARLVADLARCRMPYTCPRGRPTMLFTSYRELARKFGRE